RFPKGRPRGDRPVRRPREPQHHGRGDPAHGRRAHPRGEADHAPLPTEGLPRGAANVQRTDRWRAQGDRRAVTDTDLGELIRSRRAIRTFAAGAVPERDTREVLEAARWAPSPANL